MPLGTPVSSWAPCSTVGAWGSFTRPLSLLVLFSACLSGCQLHAHYHAAPRQEAQVEGAAADLELTPAEVAIADFLTGDGDG